MTASAHNPLEIHVAVLNRVGTVVSANDLWHDAAPDAGASSTRVGNNLLRAFELATDPASEQIASGIRAVLSGQRSRFAARHPAGHPECTRWFELCVSRLHGEAGGAIVTRHLGHLAPAAGQQGVNAAVAQPWLHQGSVEFLAYHDPVTSLPNRHCALEQLREWLCRQPGQHKGVGVLSLELAGFSDFNYAYGHSLGDRLLQQIATELARLLPQEVGLYRLAGPEFLLLLPAVDSRAALARACEQVLELAGLRIRVDELEFHLQPHLGATLAPKDGCDPEQLLRQAGMARERARRDSQHRFQVYEPRMSDELLRFVETGQSLRLALERQEFELHYQPQVDLDSGRVVGAEALMRWNRPGHGLLAPGHFIGAAEDSGLIRPMGRWALREACRQAASWHQAGWTGLKVAVNLSAIQFRHEGIRWDVLDALEESGLPPHRLELELTESLLLEENSAVSTALASWKAAGIQLAIDDFGTGYSSLSYLKRLAVDKLKIDRSFVSNFLVDDQDRCIVKAMLQMARSLRIRTVAEGIESERVARQLAALGCDEGQGFLYERPLPAAEFSAWLSRQALRQRADNA